MAAKKKAAAVVTIRDGSRMTKAGRKAIANWLRKHALWLEKEGEAYAGTFTGRYLYR